MPADQPTQKKPEACCFVIFGATGDLAHRLEIYKAGSEGPAQAEELLKRDGHSWRKLG